MAERVRRHDWASTPLGPIDGWPQSLRTTVSLLISAPVPIVLLWGEHGVMIYNDAYSVFAGGRHPQILGCNVREGWPEVADFNDNVMRVGLAGGTLAYKDQELTLNRSGSPEQVWMDLDYWPVLDESGRPGGVIATVVETTARVLSDRLRATSNERLALALSAGRGVGTWDWDIGSDRVVADARFAELYGVDPAKAQAGAPLGEFFKAMHPDDAGRVGEEIQRTVQNRVPFRSEYRLVQPDGEVRWVAAEGRIVADADGALRFPGVTFDITERRATDAALAETETRYEALFNAANTGFCILQMKFDEALRPVDYRIVEANPAFETMTGLRDAAGRWVSDIAPGLERHWFETYGRVALTGEPVRFENAADIFGRWYDVEALRIGAPDEHRVAVLFTDITERKQTERRQQALLDLNDAIRDLTDPEEIAHASSQILAESLGVSRVGYGVMDTAAETVTIARDYNAPGVRSIAGLIRFRDFGSYIEDLARGETVIISDAASDPRVEDGGAALAGIQATSLINMPLIERGQVVALLFVNHAAPRTWSDQDVALVREVAERVRVAVERARAQAELSDSEARYKTLFNEMDEGFCIIEFFNGPHGPDSDYVHVEANPAYAANAGIENVVGQKLREMVGEEADAWVERYGAVLKTGVPIRFEQELVATGRWLDISAFRVEPPERRQVAVLFNDVTAKKAAALELQALNTTLETRVAEALADKKLFADIIQSADAFVQVVDLQGRWLAINDASANEFERIFGVRPQIGQKMSDALAHLPEQARYVEAIWDRAMREAPFIEVEEFGDPNLDRRFYEMRYYPLLDATGEQIGAYQIVYDVTDRLEEQQRLKDAQEALRQAQKMEAVGQLTGGIAHDFNNLLGGISGALELLAKRLNEGRLNGMERYIDAAQSSAQRAASLTQRLLAFSRRQTLDPRPTDVNRLINGMEDLIRRSVGPNVEVEVVGAGGLWATRIDQSQLENALLNLCINARDAMAPDGGRLTIETSNKWLDDRAAKARELPPGQYVSLCVTDTGTGMPPEVQAQAFDPFFTTKPLGQGTGLGLSMIHGFVRQSGGQVRIYSELGKGTTMCLYLPRHLGDVDAEEETGLTPVADGGHGETVLIIDDEQTVRMLVAEVLGDAGYTVIEAPDGPSGLDILRSDRRIDLLISDVGLPGGMNGRQVADAARVTRPDLKVLFITGYAENAAVGNGLLAPGMEVLTKPFVMGDLAAKVHDMIEGP